MRKLAICTSMVSAAVMLAVPAVTTAAQPVGPQRNSVNSQKGPTTAAPLLGKWIVRSVELDADPTAAQIGRKPGDIIEFAERDDGNILLT